MWDEIRRDFPGLSLGTHLNTAGVGLPPRVVGEAVAAFHADLASYGDRHWDHWMARREEIRASVARLVGAQPDEIAFVANTSTGVNLIADLVGQDGDVVTSEVEFPALTLPFLNRGLPVHYAPLADGIVRPETFATWYAPPAATIALSHVQYSNGCRQDLDAFGALKAGRHLVISGSQSVGAFPVDVRRSGIDGLACAGHKWLCAGYGAGFVYIARHLLARAPAHAGWFSVEEPFGFDNRRVRLAPAARRVELGCPAFPAIFALGAAVEYWSAIGIENVSRRVLALANYLVDALERAGLPVLSPGGAFRSGEVLVGLPDPRAANAYLRGREIQVTRKPEGLRIATHAYNNQKEVDTCVSALVDFLKAR